MKSLLLLLSLLYVQSTFSQKNETILPEVEGKIIYEEIVTVDSSITQAVLFSRAKLWMAKNYVSANDVIQVSDKEEGTLFGKGKFRIVVPGLIAKETLVNHSISIMVKDGKYKYSITDLTCSIQESTYREFPLKNEKPNSMVKGFYNKLKSETDLHIKQTIDRLKAAMIKPVDNF